MPFTTPMITAAFQASFIFVKRRIAQVAANALNNERRTELTMSSRKLVVGTIYTLLLSQVATRNGRFSGRCSIPR